MPGTPELAMTVDELLRRWPRAMTVFFRHRMACVGCAMAPFDSLADAAASYGLIPEELRREIQAEIGSLRQRKDALPKPPYARDEMKGKGDAMEITPYTQVADIATHHPGTIRVFQRHGIDFCCGGKRPLAEACRDTAVDFEDLLEELQEVTTAPPAAERDWSAAPLAELAHHIVEHYHAGLRQELPRLAGMLDKVLRAHAANHPELTQVAATFYDLRAELESHMMKEERILFPYVTRLEGLAGAGEPLASSPFGSIEAPIGMMEHEHEDAARALARIDKLTGSHVPPADACPTYRGLLFGLAELDGDLKRHIHLENNILFPRAAQLETELMGVAFAS